MAPVNDTIKLVEGKKITGTVDRTNLRRALTPQAFRLSLLKQAFDTFGTGPEVTDECYLVEQLGHPIEQVAGSPVNIKVTHPDDLAVVETFIRNGYLDQV